MKRGRLFIIAIAGFMSVIPFIRPAPVFAQSASFQGITFPIAELGNCADQASCHAYCNTPANMETCTTFAEDHGLVSSSQASDARQFAQVLANGGGPGGCDSPDTCDAYCSSITHLNECISFAKAHNMINDQSQQGEKIASYLQSGGHMPGNCDSQSSCGSYCSNSSHRQECMQFAEAVGLPQGGAPGSNGAPSAEIEQKFTAVLQSGNTPGGCTTLAACEIYCNDQSHASECGPFGAAMGVGQSDMEVVQAGPGGCTSDASCKAYCSDPSHAAECRQFEEKSNYQAGPAGPGGCTSEAACKAYCSDAAHATECQQFARQSGNFVQASSTGYGSPTGGCTGNNEYWDGSECVSSGAGGPGQAPPPCPAGQQCQSGYQPGNTVPPPPDSMGTSSSPSSMLAPLSSGITSIADNFNTLARGLWHLISG